MSISTEPMLSLKQNKTEETDILQYWHNHDFKELTQLAKEILVIPGSSVNSECDCSSAEYTINKIHAGLTPGKVKKNSLS